ncbi:MAG: hypothetical protein APF81_13145 [Desulfosporosinus sp. BRH_c37]|nr:MAG: hypothetical protein APF81_13145 [Desulfosporosinus sp. BRH_c37]
MSKRKIEGSLTKKHIVDQVRSLFAEKGYTATSMNDICEATGCSRGNIYYHFKSKEDLFFHLAIQEMMEFRDDIERITSQNQSSIDRLYAYVDFFADTLQRPLTRAVEEFTRIEGLESEMVQKIRGGFFIGVSTFEKYIAEGIARGEFKNGDSGIVTVLIFSMITGLRNYALLGDVEKNERKETFRKATTLLLQGIAGKK